MNDCPKNKTFSVKLVGIKIASFIGLNMMLNNTRDQKEVKIMIFGVDMLLWYNRMTCNDNPGLGTGGPGM